jgi:hypothetical protein
MTFIWWSISFLLMSCSKKNFLTHTEKQTGWHLLFDGKTTTGWRGAYANEFPKAGWVVKIVN